MESRVSSIKNDFMLNLRRLYGLIIVNFVCVMEGGVSVGSGPLYRHSIIRSIHKHSINSSSVSNFK